MLLDIDIPDWLKGINMISLYSGTPGSGKSLHCAQIVRSHLKMHSPVIGTFHINENCLYKNSKYEYTYVNIYGLSPSFLVSFAKNNKKYLKKHIEGSFLLVIDEAQRIFNSRTWNNADRNDWITFFAEHRHLGFDVILVSQNDRMLDRQIRALIEYEFVHRKLTQAGIMGKILSIFVGQFCYVKMWYPMKEKLSSVFFHAEKKLFNFYDSFEEFSHDEDKGHGVPLSDSEKYFSKLKNIETFPCLADVHIYQKYIDDVA